jgi:hypothetical protein
MSDEVDTELETVWLTRYRRATAPDKTNHANRSEGGTA